MPRVIRTSAADSDLRDLLRYIAIEQERPRIAANLLDELLAKCELLASNPLLGTAKPEFGDNYRAFSHKRWVLIFRPIEDGVEIMRIVDGARDYTSLF